MTIIKNDLYDYNNRYIFQLVDGFKFSLDSILISEFVSINKRTKNILDLCTGNAPIPLILSTKYELPITAFEIQKDIFDLAKKSVEYNNLESQITLINDDVKNVLNYYKCESFDIITCNPPFFKVNEKGFLNKNEILKIARHEVEINLEDIFKICKKMLTSNGSLYLIHRASRLDDIIYYGYLYNINVKVVQLITTNDVNKPYIVLVKCVKNSKNGVIINKVLNVNGLKTYQNIFKEES